MLILKLHSFTSAHCRTYWLEHETMIPISQNQIELILFSIGYIGFRASLKIRIFIREQGSTARRTAVYEGY